LREESTGRSWSTAARAPRRGQGDSGGRSWALRTRRACWEHAHGRGRSRRAFIIGRRTRGRMSGPRQSGSADGGGWSEAAMSDAFSGRRSGPWERTGTGRPALPLRWSASFGAFPSSRGRREEESSSARDSSSSPPAILISRRATSDRAALRDDGGEKRGKNGGPSPSARKKPPSPGSRRSCLGEGRARPRTRSAPEASPSQSFAVFESLGERGPGKSPVRRATETRPASRVLSKSRLSRAGRPWRPRRGRFPHGRFHGAPTRRFRGPQRRSVARRGSTMGARR